jgi:hypothetical protein
MKMFIVAISSVFVVCVVASSTPDAVRGKRVPSRLPDFQHKVVLSFAFPGLLLRARSFHSKKLGAPWQVELSGNVAKNIVGQVRDHTFHPPNLSHGKQLSRKATIYSLWAQLFPTTSPDQSK